MTLSPREANAVRTAQTLQADWDDSRVERQLALSRARITRRLKHQRVSWAAAVVLAASLSGWFLFAGRVTTDHAQLAHTTQSTGASSKTVTRFADGSSAEALAGSELTVGEVSPGRIQTVLVRGSAAFEVQSNPARQFLVEAGNVRVRVVGTRFQVERSGERTRVAVQQGKVEVTWNELQTFLEAGESRWFPSGEVASRSADGAPPEPRQVPEPGVKTVDSGAAPGSAAPRGVEELLRAADAARNADRPLAAVGFLRRVLSEHPRDSRAPLAAFTLGRLLLSQLGRPAEAAEAFGRARALSPGGPLAEDALARQAEAMAQAGRTAEARQLAASYRQRFPNGKHVASLRKLEAPAP